MAFNIVITTQLLVNRRRRRRMPKNGYLISKAIAEKKIKNSLPLLDLKWGLTKK